MRHALTEREWQIIQPILPSKPRGIPRVDDRRVLNGIFWVLRSGAPWRDLPDQYGPYMTCYDRFVRWRRAGVWDPDYGPAQLIANMTKREMQPEEVLIRQGEDADDVFFVATGRVRVQITLPDGRVLRVRTMLGGAIVGEIAPYLHQSRTADVIVDASSEVFRLGADDLGRLEREDPELAALAHRLLASNLSEKLAVANKIFQLTQS